ncbi:MAG TPA: GyrI-like domain-containing protein [Methanomicrobia archaeon]|nr:GyrI-like domain-containing protein [Methanomicrobia archaeon]
MVSKDSFTVDIKLVPELQVAYIPHGGPYKGDTGLFERLFERLFAWAGARNLLQPETKALAVYYADPEVTDESQLSMSVCITVPEGTEAGDSVDVMTLPDGTYAIAHFEIDQDEYEAAWNALYGLWLPESGYQPDNYRAPFELYLNDPREHPQHKHIVDIYLPLESR